MSIQIPKIILYEKPFFLLFIALSVCTCQIEKTNPYVNSHDRFSPEIRFDTLELSDSQFFDLFSKMTLIPETKGNLTSLGTLADFNAWLKGHYPDLFIFTITAQWDGPSKMWLGIFKNTAKLYANDNDVECLFGMADYDDAQDIATYLDIKKVPTTIMIKRNYVVMSFTGPMGQLDFIKHIDNYAKMN